MGISQFGNIWEFENGQQLFRGVALRNTQRFTEKGRIMKHVYFCVVYLVFMLLIAGCSPKPISLQEVTWIHGSANCAENNEPPIQVVQYDASTWILRQNKCVHYEAPFMYLFVGQDKALLMDTGASGDSAAFPLYATVIKIIDQWQVENNRNVSLVVAHSHNHADHFAADAQFKNKPNTTVIGPSREEVAEFFQLTNWPLTEASFDLGGRSLTILPIPGHEEASIAVYDPQTHLLLTGDSFYPGRLYVRDWPAFRSSINRLSEFTSKHPVQWLVGNHIEMKDSVGLDYPTGTTYQPNEPPLPLTVADLQQLNTELTSLGDVPTHKTFDSFILVPRPPSEIAIATVAEATLKISGYPDFLAVDGADVWVTNTDVAQKLSTQTSKPILTAVAPGICGAPIVAFGSLWAASCTENTVLRIDTKSGKIIARIPCPVADLQGELSLAAGAGSIWILSDKKGILSRIDPNSNKVVAEIPVKANSFCADFGFDAVWITNTGEGKDIGSVQRIDPQTNSIVATILVGPTPRFLAAGENGIWTLNQGDGTVTRIDPTSNTVIATIDCQTPGTGGDIAAGTGYVWVRAKNGRMLQSINPQTNTIAKVYGPLNGSGAVRVAGEHVWVTAHDVNNVWVIK